MTTQTVSELAEELQMIARSLPYNVSTKTCAKIDEGGRMIDSLVQRHEKAKREVAIWTAVIIFACFMFGVIFGKLI